MNLFRNAYPLRDFGLLLLRVGLGYAFMLHGLPKLRGGPAYWEQIGSTMADLGISFAPAFWGFMAGFAEFGGGFLLLLGLFFRPVTLLLLVTMLVATAKHVGQGDDFNAYSHALEAGILFAALYFIGPGRISLDNKLFPEKPVSRLAS